jgi:hypothetical protein
MADNMAARLTQFLLRTSPGSALETTVTWKRLLTAARLLPHFSGYLEAVDEDRRREVEALVH